MNEKSSSSCICELIRNFVFLFQVWDLRQSKKALKVFEDLSNTYAQTNVSFSPDERLILTGTSAEKGGNGALMFFDKTRLELTHKLGLSVNHSGVCSFWHPRLNQVPSFFSLLVSFYLPLVCRLFLSVWVG